MAVDAAQGVMKAVAASPATFGLPFSAFVAITAGLQAAAILSKPIPAFKTGVVDYKGKGSTTSDDNLVRISNRESVITALGTEVGKDDLEILNKNPLAYKKLMREKYAQDVFSEAKKNIKSQRLYHENRRERKRQDEMAKSLASIEFYVKGNKEVKIHRDSIKKLKPAPVLRNSFPNI
ncbi:MAG: hypothetical protein EOO43_06640 [Flavobacterium sp.]|nr:MAG: hypothetical protein EOO43_06640 [Flavobacterium sp.]